MNDAIFRELKIQRSMSENTNHSLTSEVKTPDFTGLDLVGPKLNARP